MKKFWMISMLLIAAVFMVSCGGGDDEDGGATAGGACPTPGAFSCENNIVLKCDEVWQKLKQCNADQKCNAVTGSCDAAGNNGENGGNEGGNNGGNGGNEGGNNGGNGGNEGGNEGGNNGENGGDEGGNNQPQCTPKCENKECGDDGCGGTCGSCGSNQGCSTEFKCEDLNLDECTGLSMDWSEFTYGSRKYNWYVYQEGAELDMSFVDHETDQYTAPKVGEHDLSGDNASYKTCTECLYVLGIVDNQVDTVYFQNSGKLKIDSFDDSTNAIKGSLSAKFLEANIANDGTTTFVSGGECMEIESASFECVPQCSEGQECGSNGCGGECGGGCEDQACSAEGKCVPYACEKLSFTKNDFKAYTYTQESDEVLYIAETKEAGNKSFGDEFWVEFYKEDGYSHPTKFSDVAYIQMTFYVDVYENDKVRDDYTTLRETDRKINEDDYDYDDSSMASRFSGTSRFEELDNAGKQIPGKICYDIDYAWDFMQ